MKIFFRKPAHQTNGRFWINLRLEKVERALKRKEMIEVILPEGHCRPVDPAILLKYGKRTEAAYLYPDNPMKLIGSYYDIISSEELKDERAKDFSETYLR